MSCALHTSVILFVSSSFTTDNLNSFENLLFIPIFCTSLLGKTLPFISLSMCAILGVHSKAYLILDELVRKTFRFLKDNPSHVAEKQPERWEFLLGDYDKEL